MEDLIKRQAAIDAFDCLIGGVPVESVKYVSEYADKMMSRINALPSAQPETNCSEIPNNSDLISRKAAIDAVDESLTRVFVEHRDIAEKMINKIPPAPQRTGRWIDGKCDRCGTHAPYWAYYLSEYCPKCGARMLNKDGE